ncbi:MAG: hypothetical protein GY778_30300 [bacterium]|nr:hypothetical protein [bacterium]
MIAKLAKDRRFFEISLLALALGMTVLAHRMGSYKIVVLNLFYLPVVLSGYYLGRNSAGVLALFCALCMAVAAALEGGGLAAFDTPIMIGLVLTVWGGVLGLTAILVGTLCDERAQSVEDLHRAYVGVVEVLSRYLQNGNPRVKARSIRVAELSQMVAEEMDIPRKQIDHVRVGALLYDLGNMEITTQMLSRAVDTLEADPSRAERYTFDGSELVHSLGTVLRGAVPLLVDQETISPTGLSGDETLQAEDPPLGARIIQIVRAYVKLVTDETGRPTQPARDALPKLRRDVSEQNRPIIDALARVLRRTEKPDRIEGLVPA